MALYTQYDIDIRVSNLFSYISDYAYWLVGMAERGRDVTCEEDKLLLLQELTDLIMTYEVLADEDDPACCLTEAELDKICELAQELSGLCFPVKGQTEPINPQFCFIALETSTADIFLLEDRTGLLQEICT